MDRSSQADSDFKLPEINLNIEPVRRGLKILDSMTTISPETIKMKEPQPVKLDTSISSINHNAFT